MKKVTLQGTGISVSRFALGTAGLFNIRGSKKRQALLEAAVEAGFSHFDTAPYYGFGIAERALAPILRAFPHVTAATKVGLYAPGGEDQLIATVFVRKALGRLFPAASRPHRDFTLARAKLALEASFRRLGQDYVALYLLHEPLMGMVDLPVWSDWLLQEQARGRIGTYGISGEADGIAPFSHVNALLTNFIQTTDSIHGHEANIFRQVGKSPQITYGYISAARKGGDLRPVSELLTSALQRNPNGAILVSTTKPERLHQYSRVLAAVERNQ